MSRNPWLTFAVIALIAYPVALLAAEEDTAAPAVSGTAPAKTEAVAKVDATTEPASANPEQDAEPEVVCRLEAEIGSRVKKKVCRRKADIEAEQDETQDALRDVRSLGNKNYNAAPGG